MTETELLIKSRTILFCFFYLIKLIHKIVKNKILITKQIKMERKDVLINLQKVQKAIADIKGKTAHNYATSNKFLSGIGKIEEIDNYRDLVRAHMHINKETTEFENSAKALGLESDEIKDNGSKIMGIDSKKWIKDIQARVTELQDTVKLKQFTIAEAKLTAHLSDEDKFAIEMGSVSDILALIG